MVRLIIRMINWTVLFLGYCDLSCFLNLLQQSVMPSISEHFEEEDFYIQQDAAPHTIIEMLDLSLVRSCKHTY